MDMGAVLGGVVVEGRLREGLEVDVLLGTQGLEDGIEPLPRPPQQSA